MNSFVCDDPRDSYKQKKKNVDDVKGQRSEMNLIVVEGSLYLTHI